ncbi:MAG: hypothetical protein OEY33_00925 [Bdellovibrionales bacterium]|nr:hypothetical protein [Bdellovibrionales bacterium]
MKKLLVFWLLAFGIGAQANQVDAFRRYMAEGGLERYHQQKFKELFELAKYSLKNKQRVESASAYEIERSISILKTHLEKGDDLKLSGTVEELGVYEGLYLPLLFKIEETIIKKDFWSSNTLTAALGEIDPTLGEKFSDYYGLSGNEKELLRAKGVDGGGFTPHEWKQNHIKFMRMPGASPVFGSELAKGSTKNQCIKGCSEGASAGAAIGAMIGGGAGVVPGTIGGCIGGCLAEINNGKQCKEGEPDCKGSSGDYVNPYFDEYGDTPVLGGTFQDPHAPRVNGTRF